MSQSQPHTAQGITNPGTTADVSGGGGSGGGTSYGTSEAALGSAYGRPQEIPTEPQMVQALEIARESQEGAKDPTIKGILEKSLHLVYGKVAAAPNSYILSDTELSLWNYFQHYFIHDPRYEPVYRAAKMRYWESVGIRWREQGEPTVLPQGPRPPPTSREQLPLTPY